MSATYVQPNQPQSPSQPPTQFSSQSVGIANSRANNNTPSNNGNNANNTNTSNPNARKGNRAASEPLINIAEEPLPQPSPVPAPEASMTTNQPSLTSTLETSMTTNSVLLSKANTNDMSNGQVQAQTQNQTQNQTVSNNRSLLERQARENRERSRTPNVSLPVELLNKRSVRVFLELVKGCFGSRLPDEAILDAILRVAVVDDEKLASTFCKDFAQPLYIPEDDESVEAIMAKLADIRRSTADEGDSLNSSPSSANANSNASATPTNNTYRVPISPLTLRVLINCQRSLTSYLYYRVDINALAAKILDTGNYNAKQIVLEIKSHFTGLQDQKPAYK